MDYLPQNQTIIYAVLNWGLGHATRSIPVIEKLIQNNNNVILASDGMALQYLKRHFNNIPVIELPAYNMLYPFRSIVKNIMVQFYKPVIAMHKEQKAIESIVTTEKAHLVISDNRYGCYSDQCKNIFITHQIEPYHKNNIIKYFFKVINRRLLSPFDEIWIPDNKNVKLSGNLSSDSSGLMKLRFIGIQSRMKACAYKEENLTTVLLSGPEPQRTKMEVEILKMIKKFPDCNFMLIRGIDKNIDIKEYNNLKVINLASGNEVNEWMCRSKLIICRSGYSTLMDLFALNKKAILIPTPGQTEQEYLAQYNITRWSYVNQEDISDIILPNH